MLRVGNQLELPAMTKAPAKSATSGQTLSVDFGEGVVAPASTSLHIAAPWLGGASREEIFAGATPIGSQHGLSLYQCGSLLLGHAHDPFVERELVARTESVYHRMFSACKGRHLFRIWNYVPRINALTDGFENYRAFCMGRSLAFEQTFGSDFPSILPAASAVGSQGEHLDVIFVAGETVPRHFENPAQIPAYHYPAEHGPRAPSFARATVAQDGSRTLTFISGTAAIRGHETIAPGSLDEQLDCTLDNLRLISSAAGLGEALATGNRDQRFFKIYLRHARDYPAAKARLERGLIQASDSVIYLQTDICRQALNLEIEVTVIHPG
jgi:chorismate lyase / 3-hydroxybenzoate synthase